MYKITITKVRDYTDEEKKLLKDFDRGSYGYSNRGDRPQINTVEQHLDTSIDEEQFKAIQKVILETFK